MVSFALVLVLATVAVAAASPVARQFNGTTGSPSASNSTSSATCRTFYSDIYAQASNLNLTAIVGGIPANQQVLVQSSIEQFKAGSTVNSQIANASKTAINGTYSIYFEFCQPTSGSSKGVFQTHHGLVGNAAYWNVRLDGSTQNSFAEAAAAAGWSTLSYDRLGVGNSSHPDGLTVVQINYEIAQSIGIAQALRNGYLPGISNVSRVVGVGHSYGSNLLTGVASSNPTVFDALVLTGFSGNTTSGPLGLGGFASTIASVAYPDRFGNLSNAYVSTPSVSTDQQEFFHYPNYTQGLLDLFTTGKSEYSLGQLYSIAAPLTLSRTNFTRPVLVVTGDSDAPYCAANCSITSLGGNQTNLDTARPLFPSVATANFSTYVVPATGHGINYHTTASLAYNRIISFVEGLRL